MPPLPTTHADLVHQAVRLMQQGQGKQAERILKGVLRDDASQFDALLAMGVLCGQGNDLAGAVKHLQRAVRRRPHAGDALYNLGQALIGLNRHAEAADALARAAQITDTPHAHEKLGDCLLRLGRRAEAVAHYRRTVELAPANTLALSSCIEAMRKICDWRGLEELEQRLVGAAAAGAVIEPLLMLHVRDDPELHRRAAEGYWRTMIAPQAPPPEPLSRPIATGKLRIAYLSPDFRRHPVHTVVAELVERHDRSRFEVWGFSHGADDGSAERARIKAAFDRFVDVRGQSDRQIVRRIADSGIDILIDLAGYTTSGRLGVLAARPAPIICHAVGYPGTIGSPAVDYLIADPVVAPDGADAHFTEALARLPACYLGIDTRRPVAEPQTRAQHGLPDDVVVLASFNGQQKLSPALFDVWARILAAVPAAVLWLYRDDDTATANLQAEAAARAIAPERLILAGRVTPDQHLARIALADLILDTLPYGGHTTNGDALLRGVPVLVVEGRSFCARVGASLLRAAGLPELVTPSLAAYEREAIALARDPARLMALRTRLANHRDTCPVLDAAHYTRAIEAALIEMADCHRRGERPASFRATP